MLSNGINAVKSSQRTIPKLYTSTFLVWCFSLIISGAIQRYVPVNPFALPHWDSKHEIPKSATFTHISSSKRRFSDLRSLWSIPWEWRYFIPLAMSSANFKTSSCGTECGSCWCRYFLNEPPAKYSVIIQNTGGFLQAAMNCMINKSQQQTTLLTKHSIFYIAINSQHKLCCVLGSNTRINEWFDFPIRLASLASSTKMNDLILLNWFWLKWVKCKVIYVSDILM